MTSFIKRYRLPHRLRRRVELFSPQITADPGGGQVETYQSEGLIWAEIRGLSTKEQMDFQSRGFEVKAMARIRNEGSGLAPLKPGWKLKDRGRLYRVLTLVEADMPSAISEALLEEGVL